MRRPPVPVHVVLREVALEHALPDPGRPHVDRSGRGARARRRRTVRTAMSASAPRRRSRAVPWTSAPLGVSMTTSPSRSRSGRRRPRIRLAEPDEVGDERVARAVVDLARRADLLDHAVAHHHDAVGDGQRLLEVVGDVHRGDVEPALQLLQLDAASRRAAWRRGSTAARRRGAPRARTRRRGPAPPAAAGRPRAWTALRAAEVAQLDQVERLAHARRHLGLRPLPHPQAVGHVVEHAHVRPDGVGLEDHRQAAALGGNVHAARRTRRPGCRRSGSRPTSGARARRWPAAWSSCRSPRGRAASGARRRRR